MPVSKKILSAVAGLALLSFLAACNSDSTLTSSSSDLKGSVSLLIVDASTGLPLSRATVELAGVSEKRTSTEGQVTFSDVRAGNYFVRMQKTGYEPSQVELRVTTAGTEEVVAVNVSETLSLHRLGTAIQGRLLVRNGLGDSTTPAESVTVNLYSSPADGGTYRNPLRTAVTSATGWYSFDSLPELSDHSVEVPVFTRNGRSYKQASANAGAGLLTAGSQAFTVAAISLAPDGGAALTAFIRFTRLVKGQPLVLEFSNSVDTSRLVSSPTPTILLRMTPPGSTIVSIAASLTWNDDLTVLSVKPFQSDWMDGAGYTLSLSTLRDVFGHTLTSSFTGLALPAGATTLTAVQNLRLRATTTIRGVAIDTTIVDYATTPYRLSWNKATGAEGYSVYYRPSADSAWQLRATTATSVFTDTTLSLTPPAAAGKTWTRYLMVLPNSSTKQVPFTLGAALTVRDAVRPSLNTAGSTITLGTGSGFTPMAGARVIPLTVTTALTGGQNDPIDTTRRPAVRVANGPGSPAYVATAAFVWTSLTTGRVDVSVASNQDARQDTIVVDFSTVTDLSGNAFDVLPTAPVLRYVAP